ncbi:hypothetical protein Tco_0489718 [Tanacetum coccineum]
MTKGETSTPTREQNIAIQCSELNESNYTTWAIMMETILKAYGLWETLEATEKVDERKIHTTKAMILTTLSEDILMQVAQYETAKEVWESIKVRYIGEERVQKATATNFKEELESSGSTLKQNTRLKDTELRPKKVSTDRSIYRAIFRDCSMSFVEAMEGKDNILLNGKRIKSQRGTRRKLSKQTSNGKIKWYGTFLVVKHIGRNTALHMATLKYEVVEEIESRVEAESNVVKTPLHDPQSWNIAECRPLCNEDRTYRISIYHHSANIVLWTTVKIPSEVLKQRLQAGISFMLQPWDFIVQI